MMHIDVHNRKQVIAQTPDPTKCLISISSPVIGHPFLDPKYDRAVPVEGWKDVLQLCFHDVTHVKETEPYIPFTEEMAIETIDFIERNNGNEFVVHCDAGMSRSVAIAVFMNEHFQYGATLHTAQSAEYHNKLVLEILLKEVGRRRKDEQKTD